MGIAQDVLLRIQQDNNYQLKQLSEIVGCPYATMRRRLYQFNISSGEFLRMLDCLGYDLICEIKEGRLICCTSPEFGEDQRANVAKDIILELIESEGHSKIEVARAAGITNTMLFHKLERNSFKADEFLSVMASLCKAVVISSRSTGEVVFTGELASKESAKIDRGDSTQIIYRALKARKLTQNEAASNVGWTVSQLTGRLKLNSFKADEFIWFLLKNGAQIQIKHHDEVMYDANEVFVLGENASNEILDMMLKLKRKSKSFISRSVGWDSHQLYQKLSTRSLRTDEFIQMVETLGFEFFVITEDNGNKIYPIDAAQ